MEMVSHLESILSFVEEEIRDWEKQGKPIIFPWRHEQAVYILYHEIKRLQEYEWMYKDLEK